MKGATESLAHLHNEAAPLEPRTTIKTQKKKKERKSGKKERISQDEPTPDDVVFYVPKRSENKRKTASYRVFFRVSTGFAWAHLHKAAVK